MEYALERRAVGGLEAVRPVRLCVYEDAPLPGGGGHLARLPREDAELHPRRHVRELGDPHLDRHGVREEQRLAVLDRRLDEDRVDAALVQGLDVEARRLEEPGPADLQPLHVHDVRDVPVDVDLEGVDGLLEGHLGHRRIVRVGRSSGSDSCGPATRPTHRTGRGGSPSREGQCSSHRARPTSALVSVRTTSMRARAGANSTLLTDSSAAIALVRSTPSS